MIDLERNIGPMRIRAWGLLVNLIANVTMLFGLSQVVGGRGGWCWLISGSVGTILCLAILALPVKAETSS